MPSSKRIGIAILGGTGYGAGELLRLLSAHPEAEVVSVVSSSSSGEEIAAAHPHLREVANARLDGEFDPKRLDGYRHKIVFAALPHGSSGSTVQRLSRSAECTDIRFVDLSGDLRLTDPDLHQRHYPETEFCEEERREIAYGLPELNRARIPSARVVANPGCLASTCILSAAPLCDTGFEGTVVFDAKTGTSGAGRTPSADFHHPRMHADAFAYKVLQHRHEPEIRQSLGDSSGARIRTVFVPHVIPASRGILVTTYLSLPTERGSSELREAYRTFYARSPFVRVLDSQARLAAVVGSNYCDISIETRGRDVVVTAATDNLVKGMAGTAIQNMNLMCGVDEALGLRNPGLGIF